MFRIAFAFALICAPGLLAQTPFGRINGTVTDTAGALIPGATVRVINIETNVFSTLTSNESGAYDAPNLNPGQYRIEVEHSGFKTHKRGPIELHVGDVLDIGAVLEVGAVSESVTITAEAPMLESTNADMGIVVDNRRIEELPLPGGSTMYLMQLSPGIVATNPPTHGWLPQAVDAISNMGAVGTRTRSSEFSIDGIPNMSAGGQVSFSPPPEMVQEYRIQTAAFDASVGHFSGAYVNMVIKSGTNRLHGNVYFSSLVPAWATHDFFTNRFLYDTRTGPLTQEKIDAAWPPVSTYRTRVSAGGPLYIPKLYDGRNRTFWTYGVDILYRYRPERGTFTVPTEAQRSGDFSALRELGSQYQLYDPATIRPGATAGRFARDPLPGNIIPASRIDPMAKKIIGFYGLPNASGTADGRDNYSDPKPRTINYHSQVARFDHSLTANHRIYSSLSTSYLFETDNQAFHNEAYGHERNRFHRAVSFGGVFMLRPSMVVDVRYGVTRFVQDDRPVSLGYDLSQLGYAPSLIKQLEPTATTFPEIAIDGYAALGDPSTLRPATTYHTWSATTTQQRGVHTLRFGGEFRLLFENDYNLGNVSPHYDVNSSWTKGPVDNSAAAPIGQALASFMFGLPSGGWTDRNPSFAESSKYMGLFLQDDWKLRRNLTINAGLRYELELPTTERYNRAVRGFDFTTPSPVSAAALARYAASPIPEIPTADFRTPGGLLFAGINGTPRGMWNTDANNFAPRIGIAWVARPGTVVRAGYGIFFQSIGADRIDVIQQGFNQRTSIEPSRDNGQTFRATLANPFPDGILEPVGSAAGLNAYIGRNPSFSLPTNRAGYMQRWSFTLQKLVAKRFVLEAGYTGNRGTGLSVSEDYSAVPARYLSRSLLRDQPVIDQLTRQVQNPFYNMPEFAGSNMTGKTVQTQQLLQPYPQFTAIKTTSTSGFSWYHAAHVRVERRFAGGYTIHGAYTWSKFMEAVSKLNATDLAPEHVISPQDRPHRVVISGIYELPFGKNRRWLSAGGWKNKIVGDWAVQGLYLGQSGPPINFGNIAFYGDIHDIVLPRSERTVERWFNTDAGFEKDSRRALAQNIRLFPSRLTGLRADGYNNWDLSVTKNIRLTESVKLQLRGEAQDAMNHAMFKPPNAAPANSLFGQVTDSAAPEQRRINLAAKLTW